MYELLKRQEILERQKYYLLARIELLNVRMENINATQYDKISVMGKGKVITLDDLIDSKQILENELQWINEDIQVLDNEICQMEKVLKSYNDRDNLIYLYIKLKKRSPEQIGMLYGLTSRHIRRIVNNIENEK